MLQPKIWPFKDVKYGSAKCGIKRIVHPKNENCIIIYSLLCCYKPVFFLFYCSMKPKIRYSKDCFGSHWLCMDKNTMEVNGNWNLLVINMLLLCSTEVRNMRFGRTWGWVIDDSSSFWVNYPFKLFIFMNRPIRFRRRFQSVKKKKKKKKKLPLSKVSLCFLEVIWGHFQMKKKSKALVYQRKQYIHAHLVL